MRSTVREFVEIVARTLPIAEPVYEFGALQVPGQEGFADLRTFFQGLQYVGTDVRPGPGVDEVLDVHETGIVTGSVGCALVMDTLEHVEFPHRALDEMHRVLMPGGLVVISSHMDWPIHGFPNDYWRFTPQGFEVLLRSFSQALVESAGDEHSPNTVVGLGVKVASLPLDALRRDLGAWRQRHSSTGWKRLVRPFVPPALLDLYWAVRPTDIDRWKRRKGRSTSRSA